MPVPQTRENVPSEPIVGPTGDIPFIRPMRAWRSFSGLCFWVAVVGVLVFPPVVIGATAVAALSGLFAIGYMGRAARAEVDAGYAARQVVLALVLSPLLLLGVWLVPALVESDLSKWRLVEARRQARA